MPGIVLEGVSREFAGHAPAVDRLDLEVRDGELLVVVGPSGCGKTTTLRLIAGLDRPSAGEVRFDGRSMAGMSPADRNVAMVFQGSALFPHLTARGAITFGLAWRRSNGDLQQPNVEEVAEEFGIRELLDRSVRTLSGGQRQRVALCRALVRSARVHLLDEPLSNLDGPIRVQSRRKIRALQRGRGLTMVYVTHDEREAMAIADRVAVLNGGRLEQCGQPQEIYERPANRFVAAFFRGAGIEFVEGRVESGDGASGGSWRFRAEGGSIELDAATAQRVAAAGPAATLAVRADDVRLQPGNDSAAGNVEKEWIPWMGAATVESVEHLGEAQAVAVRLACRTSLVAKAPQSERWSEGQAVSVWLRLPQAQWFDGAGRRIDAQTPR